MKKLAIISAIALSGLFYNSADAQIRVHLGLHLSLPRVYVPARVAVAQTADYYEPTNYNGDEDYYYLPDVDAYYSVPEQCYYYNDGGEWISAAYLPGAYRNYDWQNARRFEVRAPRPYMHADYYRNRYNGVAFNGQWNRGYDRGGYANDNHFNNDQFRRNDQRFDNRNNYARPYDQNREQHMDNSRARNDQRVEPSHNFERASAQEHFAQNNPQRGDRGGWMNNHRLAR